MVKRLLRSSHSLRRKRHDFFKAFIPDKSSRQLKLPKLCTEEFEGLLSSTCTLNSRSNRKWTVKLENKDSNLILKDGWEKIVEDYSLEYGDFIIFSYAGSSEFKIKVFSTDGSEKFEANAEVPLIRRGRGRPRKKPVEPENTAETIEQEPSALVTNQHSKDKPSEARTKIWFECTMQKAYITKYILSVPRPFLNEHPEFKKVGSRNYTLKLSNRSWPVELVYKKRVLRITRGWGTFVSDNSLQTGVICRFELNNIEDRVFQVSINPQK